WRCIVRKFVALFCIIGLTATLSLHAQDPVKVATDPEKAGPDYKIQGEYVGTVEKDKLGAEVIARCNGNFQVNFLPGGLRGEGGDYAKHIPALAKTEGDKR